MNRIQKIEKRWNKRVVPNGWDKMGAEGVKLYLAQYGKGIGNRKLEEFATYAESLGLNDFAAEMRANKSVKAYYLPYDSFNKDLNLNDYKNLDPDSEDILILFIIDEYRATIESYTQHRLKNIYYNQPESNFEDWKKIEHNQEPILIKRKRFIRIMEDMKFSLNINDLFFWDYI